MEVSYCKQAEGEAAAGFAGYADCYGGAGGERY
jgi:hypothetical protein